MPTILLVEDNLNNQDMLSRRLKRRGFDVILAVNGEESITVARANAPELILMDMSLPVLDGWQATQRIKADPDIREIPIIALTAHAMSGDRDKALAAGCDEYESKPIDFHRLLEKINSLLSSAG